MHPQHDPFESRGCLKCFRKRRALARPFARPGDVHRGCDHLCEPKDEMWHGLDISQSSASRERREQCTRAAWSVTQRWRVNGC